MSLASLPLAAPRPVSPAQAPRIGAAPAPDGHIRSFVLRRGKITEAQEAAYEELYPRWGVSFQSQPLDWSEVFGRVAPRIVEIGFGMGETTEKICLAHPENDYLGIEVFQAGVGAMLRRIEASGLRNMRVLRHDAVEVFQQMLAPSSIDGVHLFFPDPWPKKRHHKRRLVQAPFVELLASRLKPGAYLHFATDWQPYAEQMLEVLSSEKQLENTAQTYADRPEHRPLTKFEQRGLRLGHGVWDLVFRRVSA